MFRYFLFPVTGPLAFCHLKASIIYNISNVLPGDGVTCRDEGTQSSTFVHSTCLEQYLHPAIVCLIFPSSETTSDTHQSFVYGKCGKEQIQRRLSWRYLQFIHSMSALRTREIQTKLSRPGHWAATSRKTRL